MNNETQRLILNYMLSSSDVFALSNNIIKGSYFDPEFRQTVTFTKEYFSKYNKLPDADQVKAETSFVVDYKNVIDDKITYAIDSIEKFAKESAMVEAVMSSPPLIEAGDFGAIETNIKKALMVSINLNLGVNYFSDVSQRLQRMLLQDPVVPTLWDNVDTILFGGHARKELWVFAANSGGGKSICLTNVAVNYAKQKLNVLYISLELAEDIVAQRLDTMYTGIGRKDWKEHVDAIVKGVSREEAEKGNIHIIQMPAGSTSNDFEAYLENYFLHYGFMPDVLICDYLDKMYPNEHIDMGDVFTKDKLCSEQLRGIGIKNDMMIFTASQLNRDAIGKSDPDHSNIAGGMSKINEADVVCYILMTPAMMEQGIMTFIFAKTRNSDGTGKKAHMSFNSKTLIVASAEGDDSITFVPKPKDKETPISTDIASLLISSRN